MNSIRKTTRTERMKMYYAWMMTSPLPCMMTVLPFGSDIVMLTSSSVHHHLITTSGADGFDVVGIGLPTAGLGFAMIQATHYKRPLCVILLKAYLHLLAYFRNKVEAFLTTPVGTYHSQP